MREGLVLQDKGQNEELADKGSIALLLISWSRIWEIFDPVSEFSIRNISRSPEGFKVWVFSLSRKLMETLGDLKAL